MNSQTTKLWPILPPDDRFPLSPPVWTLVNVLLAALVALPFLFVAGSAAASLWLVDTIRELLEAQGGLGLVLPAALTFFKVIVFFFAVELEYLMVVCGGVRYLIHEARHAMREVDPPQL